MNKLLYALIASISTQIVYADITTESSVITSSSASAIKPIQIESAPQLESALAAPTANTNSTYISNVAYIQNPYAGVTSGGGTLVPQQKVMESEGLLGKLFTNGTYNVYSGATTGFGGTGKNGSSGETSAYGATLFAQTGQVGGFSFGGAFTAMNPFFASNMNGSNMNDNLFTPGNQQLALTQAFLEYQYENILNADVGYIAINNSPWLSASYYNDMISVPATYQGALLNVYPGGGWLLTALAFNGVQTSGQEGFTGETFYNSIYGSSYQTNNASSNGTVALGANFVGWNNNYNLRLWGYQFDDYGTMLYGDNSIKIPLSKAVTLNFAGQGGVNNNFGANTAFTNNPYAVEPSSSYLPSSGNINSKFAGAQAGVTVDWFNATFSANTVWGPSDAVGNGAIVTPYTTNLGTDPLYAEGWLTTMANSGLTGNIYKASLTFSFLDNNLSINPNYVTLSSADPYWNGTQEVFITVNYSIPQVKGLFLFGVFAYQWTPQANPVNGSNDWTSSIVTSYLW